MESPTLDNPRHSRNIDFRDTPENVGCPSEEQTGSGQNRGRDDSTTGVSPLTQGDNTPLFDGGKGGGHRNTDNPYVTTRPPTSH